MHFFEIIAIKIEADFYLVTFLEDARLLLYLWITRKKIILELEQWTNGGTTKRMGTSVQPAFEKADRQWKHIFESRHNRTKTIFEDHEKIPQKTLKYINSPIYFHLYHGENDIGDRSAEEHLKNPKTTHVAYFGLDLSISIKNRTIHLLTQSL